MGRVIFVRHGQASLGSDDYDRLSARGFEQGERLGEHWQREGQRFRAVYRGTLRRHVETLDATRRQCPGLPDEQELAQLDEYDAGALIAELRHEPLVPPRGTEEIRMYFRLLREALAGWMDGSIQPEGMPSFATFRAGVAAVLARAHVDARDGDVLIVSSGGPISVATTIVLGAARETAIALNMRLANSALVELVTTSKGFEVESFNAQPHLTAARHLATRT